MTPHSADEFEYRSVDTLKGVGPAVASKLEKLGITTIQDLLFHLPLRYEDRTRVTPIGALQHGQHAVIEGVIEHAEVRLRGGKRGRSLLCQVSDGSGAILLRFFYFNASQQANLARGVRIRCYGEARFGASRLEMVHPEYRRLFDDAVAPVEETLTPVYPKTEGVNQNQLRNLIAQAFKLLQSQSGDSMLIEWLPPDLLRSHGFPDLTAALHNVHYPPPDTRLSRLEQGTDPAQQRLIFEELLAHQLSLLAVRKRLRKQRAVALVTDAELAARFRQNLGFELTAAQQRVIAEIQTDLRTGAPMLRLVQGDVGCGKTVVAAAAALTVVGQGLQVAVMAPTEVLAEQLYDNFSQWFTRTLTPHGRCVLLTGRDKGRARQQKLEHIASGDAGIVIGTHALFQSDVEFHRLALVVIDEQHRFGVHQRLTLRDKGANGDTRPHQLIMTATPIPRSLAMTAYADLDYSKIDELPPGRKAVTTVAVSGQRRQEVLDRVANACRQGEQAYWVCTLVEESEVLQCQAAEETAASLSAQLPQLNIGLVHGRMKADEKQAVVGRFKHGDIDLLVATTVIEVGVDAPNASLMVIENAERLGLAQLHQLRGRVGRGERQSACVLVYSPPLSLNAKQRIAILRQTGSGFEIAQKDLEMRGPGEVLGTRQTGLMQLRIADLVRDEAWLDRVRDAAQSLLQQYPGHVRPLVRRWLGHTQRYGSV
jgi:ATP-dependent DNA helicase RecG